MALSIEQVTELNKKCLWIRQQIAKYGYLSGRGHISSSLSLVETYVALYATGYIDCEKIKQQCEDRDKVILSKGHAGLGLYLALIQAGMFDIAELDDFASINGKFSTHPACGEAPGLEMSAGSLGQGIGFACGNAWASKMNGFENKVIVIVGDGELQEGSNWESIMFASQMKFDNLTILVDQNGLQISGRVDDIVKVSPLADKFRDFGYHAAEVNGHDVAAIFDALCNKDDSGKPNVIILKTVKGKGISFMEDALGWHGKGLTKEQYEKAERELV